MDIKINSIKASYDLKDNKNGTIDSSTGGKTSSFKDNLKTENLKDRYVASKEEKDIAYQKPIGERKNVDIERLVEESNKAYDQLKKMVEGLLKRQGVSFNNLSSLNLQVDDQARMEAQDLIGEAGSLSAESVSDRIVDFAIAISKGDKSKLETLVGAIKKGFAEAERVLGGKLPEISHKTYDLIMNKLEKWEKDTSN